MKRFISLLTVLALSVSLLVPALAETVVSDEGIGEETILEAGDAEFSTQGSWANGSSLPLPSGMPSWYTSSAGCSSRFEINLDPGTYEVSWWRLSHTERNDKAVELTISYNGKTETKTLSFEGADIAWEPLGSYYFSGDGNEFLEFARTADSNSDIITRTGAVRLVKVGGEAAKESASSGGVAEQLLALTGVTEGITLSEGKAPGRAEFLKMAMSVVGVGAIAGTGEPMFKDVTADHPYYGIIAAAIDFGFIHGDEQGYFRPEDPITYQEAVKIAVSVLGYEARAVRAGGYPGGYLSVASTIGLLSRVDIQNGFDGKAAAMILFNALRTEPVEMLYNDMTAAAADLTALEIYHNISFETDVVTGIDGLSLTNQVPPTGNRVRIGEALFDDPAGLAAEYIGQNVTYYYKKTTTNELVLVHAGALNEVLDIEASQIVSVTVSGGKTVTVLYDDGSSFTKKASTVAEPQVVYNGQLLSAPYVEDDFKIDSGSLRFVSSRGSRAYNLLFVYDYDIYVVNSVNKDSETVYPKYRADVLNLSRSYVPEYELINDKNGKALDLGDLNQWNVLNVLSRHSSQPSGSLTIRVTSKKVSGKLEMVSPEGVNIKGKTYKLADSFLPYAAGMTTADSGLLGSEVTVYTDITGRIVAAEKAETDSSRYVYGYQIRGDQGLDKAVTLKAFTAEGVWEEMKLADTVEYNGTSMASSQIVSRGGGLINLTKFDEMVQRDTAEYIVSVTDRTKVTLDGSDWRSSSNVNVLGPNNEPSWYTNDKSHKAVYSAAGIPAGTYGLYYWRAVLYTTTDGLDVTVNHQNGTYTTTIDETIKGNGRSWEFLGNFTFDGSGGDVTFQLAANSLAGATQRTAAIKLGAPVLGPEEPTAYLHEMALPVERPLYIEKNGAGEIKKIDTLTAGGDFTGWFYYSKNRSFVNNRSREKIEFAAANDTVIFGVPADATDLEQYRIVSIGNLPTERAYTVQPFNLNEILQAEVMVMRVSDNLRDSLSKCILVSNVGTALNSEGANMKQVRGLQAGSEVSFVGADSNTFKNVAAGDVILAAKNKNGDTTSDAGGFQLLFSYQNATPGQTGGNLHSDYCIAYGTVKEVHEGGKIVKINIGSEDRIYYLSGATTTYIYQNSRNKAVVGSLSDVSVDDHIFVRIRRCAAEEVILYR